MPENFDEAVGQDHPVPPSPVPEYPNPTNLTRVVVTPPSPVPEYPESAQPMRYPAPTQLPPQTPADTRQENAASRGGTTPGIPASPVIGSQAGSPIPGQLPGTELQPGDTDSVGMAQVDTIATWPALTEEIEKKYPLSPRTGEPCRPRTLLTAIVACWLSVACTIVAFGAWWWQAAHIPTFTSSARLLTWTHPDPVSGLAIVMVVLVGLIGLLMVAAGGTAGYNAWAGKRWIRVGALVCFAVTGLSFLLTWWFSIAMIPLGIGAALLWLPGVNRFFTAMDDLQTVPSVQVPVADILYGPQTLIGHR